MVCSAGVSWAIFLQQGLVLECSLLSLQMTIMPEHTWVLGLEGLGGHQ